MIATSEMVAKSGVVAKLGKVATVASISTGVSMAKQQPQQQTSFANKKAMDIPSDIFYSPVDQEDMELLRAMYINATEAQLESLRLMRTRFRAIIEERAITALEQYSVAFLRSHIENVRRSAIGDGSSRASFTKGLEMLGIDAIQVARDCVREFGIENMMACRNTCGNEDTTHECKPCGAFFVDCLLYKKVI